MARMPAQPGQTGPMRFLSIDLENWKNFRTVSVPLGRRVFLIGPNASGKSNFLDAFRFLSDLVAVGGGFEFAVSVKRSGVSNLRCLAARRYPEIVLRVRIGDEGENAPWQYELAFSQDNQQRPVVKRERVLRGKTVVLDRPDELDREDSRRLTQTHLENVQANHDFREVADFFRTIRYLHLVPQLVREPERSLGRENDPYGGDFLEQLARSSEKTRASRLRRIQDALKVALPQLQELELMRDEVKGTPHLRGKYEHWRPHGKWQREEDFSDGTLRLTGLLWSLLEGRGPLLLEEPELSLNPAVISQLASMFARVQRRQGRQILVSTHSPELLADEGIGLDEVLLLHPSSEGTVMRAANQFQDIVDLVGAGVSLAEAALPHTRPVRVEQLGKFGE